MSGSEIAKLAAAVAAACADGPKAEPLPRPNPPTALPAVPQLPNAEENWFADFLDEESDDC